MMTAALMYIYAHARRTAVYSVLQVLSLTVLQLVAMSLTWLAMVYRAH
jgi:hypothetical protein